MSRLDLLRQRRLGKDGNARGNLDRALDVLDVVEFEHDVDLHVVTAQEAVDRPPDRQIGIKARQTASPSSSADRTLDRRANGWDG